MRQSKLFLLSFLFVSLLGIVGCGSDEPPPAPAPIPVDPGQGGYPTAMGGSLEAPSPGTPLTQLGNTSQHFQMMSQNLSGYGFATVQSYTSIPYTVQTNWNGPYGYPTATWTPGTQAANQPISIPTYQYQGQGNYGWGYGGSLTIQLNSNFLGAQQFSFVYEYDLHGHIIYSTDMVALFEGTNTRVPTILKVTYQAQNPTIYLYEIQPFHGGYQQPYYGGQYPQQNYGGQYPQQNYGGQYPQQNYGGQYPQQNYGGQFQQYLVSQQIISTALQYPQYYGNQYQQQNYGGQYPQQNYGSPYADNYQGYGGGNW